MTLHFEREIEHLKKKLLSVGALVEENLHKATRALIERDIELASAVIKQDERVDEMEVEVEEECLKILALYQPVATDLRFIVAVLKINNDLERMSDLAQNIAERAIDIGTVPGIIIPPQISEMADKTKVLVRNSLTSLINMDMALAVAVCESDDEIDRLHSEMYRIVEKQIIETPQQVAKAIPVLTVSRYLERIADHATNIAEDVQYMLSGEIQRHGNAG